MLMHNVFVITEWPRQRPVQPGGDVITQCIVMLLHKVSYYTKSLHNVITKSCLCYYVVTLCLCCHYRMVQPLAQLGGNGTNADFGDCDLVIT